jgi:hypothetical protein
MITSKMTIEIQVPEFCDVCNLQALHQELAQHIDRFRSDLVIANKVEIRLPKGVYLPLQ